MLIADIHRKLVDLEGLETESREDILTSEVFGVLNYVSSHPCLEAVVKAVTDRKTSDRSGGNKG